MDFETMCSASCPNDVMPLQHKLALVSLAIAGWVPQHLPKPSSSSLTQRLPVVSKSAKPQFFVKCLYCRRKVFSSFSTISSESPSEDASPASTPKRIKLEEIYDINPTSDHRPHCPWINPIENVNHLGWQVALRSLVLSLEKSQSVDAPQDPLPTTSLSSGAENNSSVLSRVARTLELVMALGNH